VLEQTVFCPSFVAGAIRSKALLFSSERTVAFEMKSDVLKSMISQS